VSISTTSYPFRISHAKRLGAVRTQGREVVPDTPSLLHRQRSLAEGSEDPVNGILDPTHHKAVEQCDVSSSAGAGLNSAAGKKLEILQDLEEPALPKGVFLRFDDAQCASDAMPAVLDGEVFDGAIPESIFGLPHVVGQRWLDLCFHDVANLTRNEARVRKFA
jgi:hypothetical protein